VEIFCQRITSSFHDMFFDITVKLTYFTIYLVLRRVNLIFGKILKLIFFNLYYLTIVNLYLYHIILLMLLTFESIPP